MLRITSHKISTAEICLTLEGRLAGPWVNELLATIDAISAPREHVHLNLQQVHFADAEGIALLRRLKDDRVVFDAVSPFVQLLLIARNP